MVRLVVDSTSEIDFKEAENLGIKLIPMKVIFDGEEFVVGINMSNKEFYEKLQASKELPKTTQINITEYIDCIKPLIDNGEEVLVMSLSSALSGSFNSLKIAKEEIGSSKLEVFDTFSVTFGYKALVLEALKMIKNNKSLKDIVEELRLLREKLRLYAIIDNVKYLVKGGRLSQAKGLAVTALNIKPLVTLKDGKLEVIGKAIGFNGALKHFCQLIKNVDTSRVMFAGHANDLTKAEKMIDTVRKEKGLKFDNICEIGSVIGTHAGPGCVGVVYFEK